MAQVKAKKVRKESNEDRDQLVAQYLPYVNAIASKIYKSIPSEIDYNDLVSYGKIGLIEAAERFNLKFNVDFKTFAYYRIKGAVYDGLRKHGWLSRSQYQNQQFNQAVNDYLSNSFEREVPDELRSFEDETQEIYDTISDLAAIYIVSLDAMEGLQVANESDSAATIESECEFRQTRQVMHEAIEKLPEKERALIQLYYYEGKTLEEVGKALGITKSWTSRLHSRAVEMLQELMEGQA